MLNKGVLYIAFGDIYQHETRRSMESLRKMSPQLKIAVVTDQVWEEDPKPDTFVLREQVDGWRCKPLYMQETPFDETLFLDTDTLVCRDITGVFDLLQYYDIGVHFSGSPLNLPDLSLHTQCNSGVILWKSNEAVKEVFEQWNREYDEAKTLTASRALDARGVNDQRYLAIAIARSRARPVQLPSCLNCFIHDYAVLYAPPVILHGRMPRMPGLAKQLGIGSKWVPGVNYCAHVWMPNLRGLLPNGMRRSDPFLALSLGFRRLINELRRRWFGC